MEIKEAQKKVDDFINCFGGYWEPLSLMARMTEEVGELARSMNIKYGGKKSKHESDGREIAEELADVLFITLAMANAMDLDVATIFEEKVKKDYDKCKGIYSE